MLGVLKKRRGILRDLGIAEGNHQFCYNLEYQRSSASKGLDN